MHTVVVVIGVIFGAARVASDVNVKTKFGTVLGNSEDDSDAFYGIPFAKPPERWRPPEALEVFPTDPYRADSWKPMCYQICTMPEGACGEEVSEDCLYLNIFAPKNASSDDKKAVMVFVHGGAFDLYTGSADLLHGGIIARKGDIIVVTLNYRLNVFGGLVTGQTDNDATGNYGIQDQRMAIEWVHENIADFGGDPNKITLSGQSAGAQSVLIHMMANKVTDKFAHALIQSAPISVPFRSYEDSLKQGETFASEVGCKSFDIACMRNKTAKEVYIASLKSPRRISDSILQMVEAWAPVVDKNEVPKSVYEEFVDPTVPWFSSNGVLTKPTMIGTVRHEAAGLITFVFKERISFLQYIGMVFGIKHLNGFRIISHYTPHFGQSDMREIAEDIVTDFVFVCPARMMARRIQQTSPVWMYSLEQVFTTNKSWGTFDFCEGKACHGQDLMYLFQQVKSGFSPDEKKMSDTVIQYVSNFVKTGNPNIGSESGITLEEWPRFESTMNHISFSAPHNAMGNHLKTAVCDMWDDLQPYYA
ncbi:hypothetical protein ScPMuIL_015532 [Solemya velum]